MNRETAFRSIRTRQAGAGSEEKDEALERESVQSFAVALKPEHAAKEIGGGCARIVGEGVQKKALGTVEMFDERAEGAMVNDAVNGGKSSVRRTEAHTELRRVVEFVTRAAVEQEVVVVRLEVTQRGTQIVSRNAGGG